MDERTCAPPKDQLAYNYIARDFKGVLTPPSLLADRHHIYVTKTQYLSWCALPNARISPHNSSTLKICPKYHHERNIFEQKSARKNAVRVRARWRAANNGSMCHPNEPKLQISTKDAIRKCF